ncbi:hypothetical protein C1M51_03285 [Methylibium sp. Pch-M]|uniref:hypothetical protein n=1 Tax=Methylibium sp. Pch-M TaxID=2082386 RepID=UPI001011DF16|nr:hypothetical protein [Methylibium sp. Pch-M]QAZ38527.1 hypothetical protein C1M51_03285 [Methylibium sp. Pch-M]
MHLVIPFAAPLSEAGRHALGELALPALDALLGRLTADPLNEGDEYQLSPPHERVLARALGWRGADGALPWAARAAAADGLDTGDLAWGLLSPVHWQIGREHLTMDDPESLALDAAESRAAFDAVRPLFESEGWLCAWGAPTRWYVAHETLADLPTASLDRVIGRNPDLWMPEHPAARFVKRLQNEVQMLLYTHALNDAREASGRDPLNSFWLSGCGPHQPDRGEALQVLDALRAPALREDWAAWSEAWRALDAGPLREALARARRGEALRLSLCGERHAQDFVLQPRGVLAALRSRFQQSQAARLMAAL